MYSIKKHYEINVGVNINRHQLGTDRNYVSHEFRTDRIIFPKQSVMQ